MKITLFMLLLFVKLPLGAWAAQEDVGRNHPEAERKRKSSYVYVLPGSDAFWHHETLPGTATLIVENPYGTEWNQQCGLFGNFPPVGRQIVSDYLERVVLGRLLTLPDNNVFSLYDVTREILLAHAAVGAAPKGFRANGNSYHVILRNGPTQCFDLVPNERPGGRGVQPAVAEGGAPVGGSALDRHTKTVTDFELKHTCNLKRKEEDWTLFHNLSKHSDHSSVSPIQYFPEHGWEVIFFWHKGDRCYGFCCTNDDQTVTVNVESHIISYLTEAGLRNVGLSQSNVDDLSGINPALLDAGNGSIWIPLGRDRQNIFVLPTHQQCLMPRVLHVGKRRVVSVCASTAQAQHPRYVVGSTEPNGITVFTAEGQKEHGTVFTVTPEYILYADAESVLVSDRKGNLCTALYRTKKQRKGLVKRIMGDCVVLGPTPLRKLFYRQVGDEADQVISDVVTKETRAHSMESTGRQKFVVGPLLSGAFAIYDPIGLENNRTRRIREQRLVKTVRQDYEEAEKKRIETEKLIARKAGVAHMRNRSRLGFCTKVVASPQSAASGAVASVAAAAAATAMGAPNTPAARASILSRSSSMRGFGSSVTTGRDITSSSSHLSSSKKNSHQASKTDNSKEKDNRRP